MAGLTAFLSIVACLALFCAGPSVAWTLAQEQAGRTAYNDLTARFGGEYRDDRLADYVSSVGMRLVEGSDRSREPWRFTVLDSPTVNAFFAPAGHVMVTRGLLAAARSEAELASILAHEIASVTLGRSERDAAPLSGPKVSPDTLRETRSAAATLPEIGRTATDALAPPDKPTREAEADASRLAVDLMAAAGYRPSAYSDILDNLSELRGMVAGLDGIFRDPGTVDYFESHRFTAGRVEAAIREARAAGVPVDLAVEEGVEPYLEALDGLVYGDSPLNGIVEGSRLHHPVWGIAIDIPDDFQPVPNPDRFLARGPGGAVLAIEPALESVDRLESYIRDRWAPSLTRSVRAGYVYDLQQFQVNGLPAASAFQPYEDEESPKVAQLVVIRVGGRHFRISAIAAAEDLGTSLAMSDAIQSLRALDDDAADALAPYRLMVYRVQPGDTVNLLSAAMSLRPGAERRFRALNDYDDGKVPLVGDLVKLITR